MNTTKVFISGKSQAVRIPKDFRFKCDEVYIQKKAIKFSTTC
ncbi:MAG: AbrB/MazE/SpoVT family DNA-binding domain-containing protein [Methylococcales bacterium]|nr:AbrB/MazE/SpoVT family DNA-binding domain-containing protein [Methylococcales bacterium]